MHRSLQIFEESVKSPATLKSYKKALNYFLKFTRVKDYDSLVRLGSKSLQCMV